MVQQKPVFLKGYLCNLLPGEPEIKKMTQNAHVTVRQKQGCYKALRWDAKQQMKRLFTVLYFSVRSSRSSALRYGLPSCMSVKTALYGAGLVSEEASYLKRYIWKSRWPPLPVRRAISRRSHEEMGYREESNRWMSQPMLPALQTIAGMFSKARLRAAALLSSWLDAGARLRSLSEE